MKLQTLFRIGGEYQIGQLELKLIPGLPQWQILGLPDQTLKESLVRVSAALRDQGYEVPAAHKVLIQLHPTQVKKQCRGIDLAIALALLVETQQLPPSVQEMFAAQATDQHSVPPSLRERGGVGLKSLSLVYGTVTLGGDIHRPVDIGIVGGLEMQGAIITGAGSDLAVPASLRQRGYYAPRTLDDLRCLGDFWHPPEDLATTSQSERPALQEFESVGIQFSSVAARAMMITAAGEHPTLVAGPSGQGKSTWVRAVSAVLPPLQGEAFASVQKWGWRQGVEIVRRPIVEPHHSASAVAILGGGHPPVPGEISRAHGGTLVMDEFLEFSPMVQEALREPLETGQIRLARHGYASTYPARFLLLATTNLCPCGEYVPVGRHKCRCRLTRRRQYLERLSGPLLDRFGLLLWCHEWQARGSTAAVSGWARDHSGRARELWNLADITQFIDQARHFAQATRAQNFANQRLPERQLIEMFDPFVIEKLLPTAGRSRRRRRALLSVARTVADLEGSEKVELSHIEEAAQWTLYSFYALQGFS